MRIVNFPKLYLSSTMKISSYLDSNHCQISLSDKRLPLQSRVLFINHLNKIIESRGSSRKINLSRKTLHCKFSIGKCSISSLNEKELENLRANAEQQR